MPGLLAALVLAALAVPSPGEQVAPTHWRLRCRSTTTSSWHLCDLEFKGNRACTGPLLSGNAQDAKPYQRRSSAATTNTYQHASAVIYDEWESSCTNCAANQYVGVVFDRAAVVQCVKYTVCGAGGGNASAATTTANPFGGLGRRLEGSPVSCTSPALERSNDGSQWSMVAGWTSMDPQGSGKLSLDTATEGPSTGAPAAMTYNPPDSACGGCGREGHLNGQPLVIEFTSNVYPGGGEIRIERGGLSTLAKTGGDADWFDFNGKFLTVRPQDQLGASGSCSVLRIGAGAVFDADGQAYNPDLINPYSFCMADVVAPEHIPEFTEPQQGSANTGPSPRVEVAFNEGIRIPTAAPAARLEWAGGFQVVTLTGGGDPQIGLVRTTVWNANSGAGVLQVDLVGPLQPEMAYALKFQAGAVEDFNGNIWGGATLNFATRCAPTGCLLTTTPASSGGGATTSACEDTAGMAVNLYGRGCSDYYLRPEGCGEYDDDDFASNVMCCPCGGGSTYEGVDSSRSPIFLVAILGTVLAFCCSGAAFASYFYKNHVVVRKGDGRVRDDPFAAGGSGASAGNARRPPNRSRTMPSPGSFQSDPLRQASQAGGDGRGASKGGTPAPKQPQPSAPRAAEAEDARPEGWRSKGGGPQKPQSQDDSNTVTGGWMQYTDRATGKPYWVNYKTKETRWDPPPRAGFGQGPQARKPQPQQAWGNGQQQQQQQSQQQQSSSQQQQQRKEQERPAAERAQPSPAKEEPLTPEEAQARRVIAEVEAQLESTRKEDIASRKKTFKFLQLKWHPDKNMEDKELANRIFQYLQTQKDWYLKE